MPATGGSTEMGVAQIGRMRSRVALATLVVTIAGAGSGCSRGGTTTTLAVTVETDATLVGMLDEIAMVADASGRPEATTRFTALSESLRWTIRIPNVASPFDALVSATGRSGGRDVVATAA